MKWICCQIGAREHYAVPRARHRKQALSLLITDAWADSWLPWKLRTDTRAAERFHPDIPSDLVRSFDWSLLRFEMSARRRLSGWTRTIARNDWFQLRAISILRRFRDLNPGSEFTLFSYSYAAVKLFEFAKESGWSTVLGQIDPGPFEEKIVMNLNRPEEHRYDVEPAPGAYWESWHKECRLADRIIVNSEWSRHGLQAEGVNAEKIQVVPLAYDPPPDAANFVRKYPAAFDFRRPLRILFLGQVNIRKGLSEILGAIAQLEKLPVEFRIVGDVQLDIPAEYVRHPRVKWFGTVPRGATAGFYRDADVFLFPTFSDGFGLTQLEARAWNLPIIASRRCGDVVEPGINGYLLPEISADAITRVIKEILADPAALLSLAGRASANEFSLDRLSTRLARMTEECNPCWSR
jgi:glycosyltransferase involved in cell wall biosynthesis